MGLRFTCVSGPLESHQTNFSPQDAHGHIPGFKPFALSKEAVNVVNRNLTKALGGFMVFPILSSLEKSGLKCSG